MLMYISASVFVIGIISGMLLSFYNSYYRIAAFSAAFILSAVLLLISRFGAKTVLTVTDKRIYGKNDIGENTIIPMENISRMETGENNSIILYSSQKNASFSDIDNIDNVINAINGLLFVKQNQGLSENFRSLNELFDSGKISEDEYLKRKRKLLKL